MPRVIYIEPDGTRHDTTVEPGISVMDAARRIGLAGIEGDCGGMCACSTCHVYVDPQWTDRVGAPDELERDMLTFAYDVDPTSRLACQISLGANLDGLIVRLPSRQY